MMISISKTKIYKKPSKIKIKQKRKKKIRGNQPFYLSPFQKMIENLVKNIMNFGMHRHLFPACDNDGEMIE